MRGGIPNVLPGEVAPIPGPARVLEDGHRGWHNILAVGMTTLAMLGAHDTLKGSTEAYGQGPVVINGSGNNCVITGDQTTSSCSNSGEGAPETPAPEQPAPAPPPPEQGNEPVPPKPKPKPEARPRPERPSQSERRGSETTLSPRQRYAREVLALIDEGRIKIEPLRSGLHARDTAVFANPLQNLNQAARGEPSNRSERCGNTSGNHYIAENILKFMARLGRVAKYGITAIVGACHAPRSNHYIGQAVDIGCQYFKAGLNHTLKLAKKIGDKLGIKQFGGENCATAGHTHWSGGRRAGR